MIERVAVVVPAADEQDRIGACLTAIRRTGISLLAGLAGTGRAVSVDVVVALDACTDGTAGVVDQFAEVTAVHLAARRVGTARRDGTRVAVQRAAQLGVPVQRLWLANTDADSLVPPDWLGYAVTRADAGDELLLGTVRPDHELDDARTHTWHDNHTLSDGHPHIHGANLGVRADVLARLGGWPPLATGEDIELVSRARAAGARIHRAAATPVLTSARTLARAPAGFSSYLRHLASAEVGAG